MGDIGAAIGAESPLIEAVRAGRAHVVRELLWAGADPETTDAAGVPALCLAVDAFDGYVADALLAAGADSLRPLPDDSTPLLRVVASGNAGLTARLLIDAADRLTDAMRAELLACARRWSESGAEAGLRGVTGATGPAETRRIADQYGFSEYDLITLGGISVYEGHVAVLTRLEAEFGIRRSFEDLLDRALVRADPGHADWSEVTTVLADRLDDQTWAAAVALRSDPDPLRRHFAADLIRLLAAGEEPFGSGIHPFEQRALDVFLPWAGEETDPATLAAVLWGLTGFDDPRIEETGLAYRAHPDPRVRVRVPWILHRTCHAFTHPEALDVLATLAHDPDAAVRRTVCERLYESGRAAPAIADILAGFLDEDDQLVRIKAVSGLADADDPRCVAGARLIGPVDRTAWSDTWLLDAVDRYERRRSG